ncbi:MAG: cytochrome P450 [Acidobacteriaceae bacterium]|nr:cytochrome P450 [Acidobacteriaceae bacterium]
MITPPGPRGRAAYRFLRNGSQGGTIEFLLETARTYGPVSSFQIFGKRIYVVDDAELIRDMLVTRQHEFVRDSGANLLRELVGDGLITREEPSHKERRRLLQPAFHRDQVASYAATMVRETETFSSGWQNGATVDIRREMRRLTLSIVGACLFGTDFRDSADAIANVLGGVARKSVLLAPAFAFIEPFAVTYRKILPNGPSLFFRKERAALDRIIAPLISSERARQGSRTGTNVLELILQASEAEGSSLTDEEVRNEIVTFVLAGHETTATALTWAWYLLGRHPEIAERMRDEIDSVLGRNPLTLESFPLLTYTNQVFHEALRLYPPALAFARRPKKKLRLGGYEIPAGASIFMSPYATQRNARYFERPDDFDPDRWTAPNWPKFAFFPFGGGAKMCIGEPFARMEGVIALAILGRSWQVLSTDSAEAGLANSMLLQPDRILTMQVRSRVSADRLRPIEAAVTG